MVMGCEEGDLVLINMNNIRLSFADRKIFDGITWTITEKSRIGLVGDNGTGKTTLLRLITGEVEPDSGAVKISGRKTKTIGYLPQDLAELEPVEMMTYLKDKSGISRSERAIREYEERISRCPSGTEEYRQLLTQYETAVTSFTQCGGYAFEAKAKQILRGFGFRDRDFSKKCNEFSGGWKMRIMLAVILLAQPDIMILDEPVNHLDTESMEWLESYLKDCRSTIIAVAHDRFFLDKITNQTAELSNCRIALYKGNYSYYLKEKERRREADKKRAALQKIEVKRIQEFVERFRYKATKASQVQSRLKRLEKLDLARDEAETKRVTIRFPECPKSGKEVVSVSRLVKCYGDQKVFDGLQFSIYRGDRVALVGINGAGKSTLLRILGAVEEPTAGTVRHGLNVKMAFFSQESAENLDYEKTVWEEACTTGSRSNDQQRRDLLGAFLFSGEDIYKTISVLSGGEKSRLALLKTLLGEANFLILDEPTNHLDLKTKDIFQRALLDYSGTIVIVSHDRYFLDQLVNRVMELRDGEFYEYGGNYSYFIEKRKEYDVGEHQRDDAAKKEGGGTRKTQDEKRLEAEDRNRTFRIRQALREELTAVEREITRLEARRAEDEALLCDPRTHRDPARIRTLRKEMENISRDLERLYASWEAIVVKMESVERPNGAQGYPPVI